MSSVVATAGGNAPSREAGGGEGSARALPAAAIPPAARRPPFTFGKRHGVLVTDVQDGVASTVHRAGATALALAELRRFMGIPLRLRAVGDAEFDRLLATAYEHGSDQAMQVAEGIDGDTDLSRVAQQLAEPEDLLESEDDAPIIRLINALLTEAIKENASDVHIEPLENRLVVRFRTDGVMREVLAPKRGLASIIASRVKVMARLDIAEKRLPQDGRISLRVAGRAVDVRVSTIPSAHGERVVLRLLDKHAGRLDLEQIGMPPALYARMVELIHRPHGIILVTGPTGSGKTTTLYAVLGQLNDRRSNIMTVEDPIEYFLDGVGQTQVNPKVDMSFARGLRAILRQDPDIVMVGEIRDVETVHIAIQASLTGHLVLSTLHTNTAVGAVTRLRDMGVEPFLLSSSLLGVLAQRLVRLLCPHCRRPYTADRAECARLGVAEEAAPVLYLPEGCNACKGSGYRGRAGIYELVVVDDTLRSLIHDGTGEQRLEAQARTVTPSIWDHGRERVLAGETALEEVLRVTEA